MASLAELMVRVGADISEFTRNMQSVDRTMQSTGQGMMKTGKSISDVGSKMGLAITTPLLALGATAVVIGAKFDSEMSKVQAITGATGSKFDEMRNQAIKLGADTAWSSSESAQAMYQLASAGFSVDEIMKTVPSVLSLASAGGLDLATSADIASSALRGFNLPVTQAQHVMDVLAKTAGDSNAEVSGLGESFKYVAPIAGTLGISIEDASAMLGEMANQGIKASQAGTTMRMGLLRMTKPTKQATAVMKEYGLSFFDAQGHMKTLPEIIGNLQHGFKGLTDQQKLSALSTLFGAEAVSGWSAVVNQGSDKLKAFSDELKNSDGSAKKMADTMTNNLNGAWLNLTGSLESLAISFADVMKGDLQNLAGKISELVNWFTDLDPATKKVIVVVGLFVASIAPLLTVIGFVAQGIGALSIAFGAISAPVLIVIGVVTLLIVLFRDQIANLFKKAMSWVQPIQDAFTFLNGGFNKSILDAKHYGGTVEDVIGSKAMTVANILTTMRAKFSEIWTAIVNAITPIVNTVKAIVVDVFTSLKAFWEKNGAEMLAKIEAVWGSIMKIVQPLLQDVVKFVQEKLNMIKKFWDENGTMIMTAVKNVFEFILTVIQFIMPVVGFIVNQVWESIKGAIDGALNVIMGLIKVFAGLFTGNWGAMWDGVKQLLYGAVELIWNVLNLMFIGKVLKGIGLFVKGGVELFQLFGETIVGFFKDMWTKAWNIVDEVGSAIKTLFTLMKQHGESTFNAMKGVIESIWTSIKNGVMTVVNALKDGVVAGWNFLKSSATTIFNALKSIVESIWNGLKGSVTSIVDGMKTAVSGVFNGIKDVAVNIFNFMKSALTGNTQGMKDALVGIWNGIKSAVSSVAGGLKDAVVGVFNNLKGTASGIFDAVKSAMTSPIDTAKSVILGIIDDIKGAFARMIIKIPKPSLPKVSVAMKTGVMGIPYPDFNVSWNAKGAIFNKATVLGGGQGVGEAGAEAVIPIENRRYMAPFARAIADNINSMNKEPQGNVENNFHFAEGAFVVREEADIEKIAQALYDKQKRTNRRNGL